MEGLLSKVPFIPYWLTEVPFLIYECPFIIWIWVRDSLVGRGKTLRWGPEPNNRERARTLYFFLPFKKTRTLPKTGWAGSNEWKRITNAELRESSITDLLTLTFLPYLRVAQEGTYRWKERPTRWAYQLAWYKGVESPPPTWLDSRWVKHFRLSLPPQQKWWKITLTKTNLMNGLKWQWNAFLWPFSAFLDYEALHPREIHFFPYEMQSNGTCSRSKDIKRDVLSL